MYNHLRGCEILEKVPSWFLLSHFIQLQILVWLLLLLLLVVVLVVVVVIVVVVLLLLLLLLLVLIKRKVIRGMSEGRLGLAFHLMNGVLPNNDVRGHSSSIAND